MAEVKKRILKLYRSKYWLLALILFSCGCGFGDQLPSLPAKVSGKDNTFEILERVSLFKHEKITAIQICEPSNNPDVSWDQAEIYWRIVAEKPIDMEAFEFTVGAVPDGFVQEIPSKGKGFTPLPGKIYIIAVQTDNPEAPPWAGIHWIAK